MAEQQRRSRTGDRTRRTPGRHLGTLVAAAVVLGWLVVGAVAGPFAGSLSEVATNDNAAFLPADAEATRAQDLAAGFVEQPTTPALVVYERSSGLTEADRERAAADAAEFAEVPGVAGPVSPPIPSEDGQALQVVVPVSEEDDEIDVGTVVDELRRIVADEPEGLNVHVAGPAGLLADLVEVFSAIDATLLAVTAGVVLVILLVVYRSPVLWIAPLLAAALSYALAAIFVYLLADAGVVALNGQAQGILTVLVFGAGTDYALLLIARYREELHRHERPVEAIRSAWKGAAPAIIASGATTITSLLCLLLSGLNSNRSLGPIAALGIAATLLVMLTFLPALLLLGGRWAFWPRTPKADQAGDRAEHRLWARIADVVARRARTVWAVTAVALAVAALGLTQLGPTALGQTDLFTQRTDSVAGQEAIARHYPGGTGSPTSIFATAETAEQVAEAARAVPGVAEVRPAASGTAGPGGSPGPGTPAGPTTPTPPSPGAPSPGPAAPGQAEPPRVVDGRIQLAVTLAAPPDSAEAEQTLRQLRTAVRAVPGADAVVGGFTAINVDTDDAATRDRNVIIPTVLAVITVILVLLLRSLVAPLLLIATVVLSYLSALGICALIFRHLFGFPGVDTSFPLFAFVFLVALGIDYNIFLMSRVRQEAVRRGTRPGVLHGLVVTGGVITSAGVVLAATFSALAVLPLVVLVELGVAVAVGVLIDTIVVRSLLVPALVYDIGRPVWWPHPLARSRHRRR